MKKNCNHINDKEMNKEYLIGIETKKMYDRPNDFVGEDSQF